jgi:4'-phosphopantetheinyl transferase
MMIYLNDQIETFDLQAALGQLSPQRLQQVQAFKPLQSKKLCAAAYLLLRQGLQEEYGISEAVEFEYGEHGKPSLIGYPDIHFNLSHCREAAICVLSDHPVGVDIESIGRQSERLMRYVLSDEEYEQVKRSSSPDVEFTCFWTKKESMLKLTGEGINTDLKLLLPAPYRFTTVVNEERGYVYTLCTAEGFSVRN